MGAEQSQSAPAKPVSKAEHAATKEREKEPNDATAAESSPSSNAATTAAQQRTLHNIASLLGSDEDDATATADATVAVSPPPLTPRDSPSGSPEPPQPPVPVPVRPSAARTGVGEAHLDLWNSIVEWVAAAGPAAAVTVAASGSSAAAASPSVAGPAATANAPGFGCAIWDSETVAELTLSLPSDPRLARTLADRAARRRAARAERARASKARERVGGTDPREAVASPVEVERLTTPASSASSSSSSSFAYPASSSSSSPASAGLLVAPLPPGVPIPYPLAQQLLTLDPALAALRLAQVPSKVSEDTFWDCYFAALLVSVREHVDALHLQRRGSK